MKRNVRVMFISLGIMLGVFLILLAVPNRAGSEGYKDDYLIASEYYRGGDTAEYRADYDRIRQFDRSAARAMFSAASDVCRNRGDGDRRLNPSTFRCEPK